MQISFVGEGAVDQGGPKREFFRLLAQAASKTFFKGSNSKTKFLDNNITAVQVRNFTRLL